MEDARYRQVPGARVAAGFFTIDAGQARLLLKGAKSEACDRIEMHRTEIVEGISRMRPIDDYVVEPDTTGRFEPGGNHLMLFGCQPDNRTGMIEVELVFETGRLTTKLRPERGEGDHEGH